MEYMSITLEHRVTRPAGQSSILLACKLKPIGRCSGDISLNSYICLRATRAYTSYNVLNVMPSLLKGTPTATTRAPKVLVWEVFHLGTEARICFCKHLASNTFFKSTQNISLQADARDETFRMIWELPNKIHLSKLASHQRCCTKLTGTSFSFITSHYMYYFYIYSIQTPEPGSQGHCAEFCISASLCKAIFGTACSMTETTFHRKQVFVNVKSLKCEWDQWRLYSWGSTI